MVLSFSLGKPRLIDRFTSLKESSTDRQTALEANFAFKHEVAYSCLAFRFFRNGVVLLPEAETPHAAAPDIRTVASSRLYK